MITISNLESVVGKWEGTVVRAPFPPSAKNWIRMNIFITGIYEVVTEQAIDVCDGTGRLNLTEGGLVAESQNGKLVMVLLRDQKGELSIHMEAVAKTGRDFAARLKRTSMHPLPLQLRSQSSDSGSPSR